MSRHQITHAWLHELNDAILLDIEVAPKSSRSRVMGAFEGHLKVQLAASDQHDNANMLLVRFLGRCLRVAPAQIDIVGGASNRRKTVRLRQVSAEKVILALAPSPAEAPS